MPVRKEHTWRTHTVLRGNTWENYTFRLVDRKWKAWLTIRPTSEEAGVHSADKELEDRRARRRTRGDSHRDEDASHAKNGDTPLGSPCRGGSVIPLWLLIRQRNLALILPATRSHWKWWVTGNGVLGWVWATDMSQVSSLGSWGVWGVITRFY